MNHRYTKLSPTEVRTMIELYRNGWTMPRLATRYGVGKSAIWHLLHIRGIPTRPRHRRRVNGKFVKTDPDTATRIERDNDGIIVVMRAQESGEERSMHFPGLRLEALHCAVAWMDAHEGDWRLICYSTPETILGDLRGLRADVSDARPPSYPAKQRTTTIDSRPEKTVLGRVGRLDLLDPSLDR